MGVLRNVFEQREPFPATVFDYGDFQVFSEPVRLYLSQFGSKNVFYSHPIDTSSDAYHYIVTDHIEGVPSYPSSFSWRIITNSGVDKPKVVAMDIETSGLEANDAVEMIGLYDAEEDYYVILDGEEEDIFPLAMLLLSTMAPTLIVGHNISEFDIPHIQKRWQRLVNINDEYSERFGVFPFRKTVKKFRIGMEQENLSCWLFDYYWTAQVVDTLPLSKRLDNMTGGNVGGYGLKQLVYEWGLNKEKRTEKYHELAEGKRYEYLLEDLKDTANLFSFVTEWFYGLFRFIPITWNDIYTGTGSLVNMFFTAWLAWLFPVPKEHKEEYEYMGGHVELRNSGYFKNVWSIDVVSMYPNIMCRYIQPRWDVGGWFSALVRSLLDYRLEAKRKSKTEPKWEPIQKALKIVINSIYGYLATGLNYSDKRQAEEVTRIGRELVQQMANIIERCGGIVIEIDTDGIYFSADNGEEIQRIVEAETGFETELSRYDAGLFVKKKNYALWKGDTLKLKGNSLRSRSDNKIYTEIILAILDAYHKGDTEKRLRELWQRCWDEYVYYELKTAPKGWYAGKYEPQKDNPTTAVRLDRLEKLKAVFMRFDTLPEIVQLMNNENRVTWRRRIEAERQYAFPF